MRIASYNINGINSRLELLLRWLKEFQPDIVAVQEIKCTDESFPRDPLETLGYECLVHGQKSWNGVALLSRVGSPVETRRSLPGDPHLEHSRYIEAAVSGVLIGNLYAPNGNPSPGPKFDYKLSWLQALLQHTKDLLESEVPAVIIGDFNIIPSENDAYKPERWVKDALFAPAVRELYASMLSQGWTDALRALHPHERCYTFWPYWRNAFQRDAGIRIDHALISPSLRRSLRQGSVDRTPRAWEKTSDHAPVWIELEF